MPETAKVGPFLGVLRASSSYSSTQAAKVYQILIRQGGLAKRNSLNTVSSSRRRTKEMEVSWCGLFMTG